jgi:hypothetical protein
VGKQGARGARSSAIKKKGKQKRDEIDKPSVPDRAEVALKDKITVLQAALKKAQREANELDVVREVVGLVARAPREVPGWVSNPPKKCRRRLPEVPVTMWSDWHLGEVVSADETNGNKYDMAIAEERVHRLVDTTVELCRLHSSTAPQPGIVVCLGGDAVSGGLHPELKATDEVEPIPAAIKAVDWIAAGLERLADEFGRVYVPGVCGNHGRLTAKPEFKRYYRKNFDWLILQCLIRHFEDDRRVQIDVRPSNEVHFRVYNERYLLMHGDMLGVKGGDGIIGSIGPIMRGEVKVSGQSSSVGLEFDKLLIGHWHQRLWLPRVICSGTLKGFDEYARLQLRAKPDVPTQPLWFVHPERGITTMHDLFVEPSVKTGSEPWVSWQPTALAA